MDIIQNNKMHKNDEILEYLSKWGALFAYIGIGLIGKLGWDIVNNRKISWWYLFGTGCIGVCIGYLAWIWCIAHAPESAGFVVPIATLISRDIMLFINMIDWQGVLKLITRKGTMDKK